jgi:diguanylate cyclase (GGDEF)-like protein
MTKSEKAFKNPPAGLVQRPDGYFRRRQREIAFYFSTTFRLHAVQLFFCSLIVGAHILLMYTPLLQRFEYVFLDLFFRNRTPIHQHPAITYIDMAEDSLQVIGRWPWPRHNHAALIHILHEWGAKAIVFDVVFSEPSTSFDDGAMTEAMQEADNVYLPDVLETVHQKKVWTHPVPEFEKLAKGTGHINITPDRDGTLRRISPVLDAAGEKHPYIPVKVAYDYLGKPVPEPGKYPFPTDSKGKLFINWAGRWKEAFQHLSFVDVIRSYAQIRDGKKPVISPDLVKDKICLIGLTAIGLTDIKANPLEETYPAVGVQANILNSILTNQFIYPASEQTNILATILVGLIAAIIFTFAKRVSSLIAGLVWGVLWAGFVFWLFQAKSVWLFVVNPLLLIVSLFVFSAAFSLTIGRREQERLFTLATRDGLTGLYVIRHFRFLLNEAVVEAHKKKAPMSLIIFDLDHFKHINDTYGHQGGDVVLRHLAQILRDVFKVEGETQGKERNPVSRYGGEEFIVLLKECTLIDAAFNYGEQVRKRLEQSEIVYEGKKIPITISLGVATLHPEETVPDIMVHRADDALYRAKEEGRNRTCLESDQHKAP